MHRFSPHLLRSDHLDVIEPQIRVIAPFTRFAPQLANPPGSRVVRGQCQQAVTAWRDVS